MMFTFQACGRLGSRVIHAELHRGTAAVEGQYDHEVVAIIPYKTDMNGARQNPPREELVAQSGKIPGAGREDPMGQPGKTSWARTSWANVQQ
jgi:hypothetical protein